MSKRSPARLAALLALGVLVPAFARGQQQTLTLDDIYHPEKKVDFTGSPPTGLSWIDDTHYLWSRPTTGDDAEVFKVEALTGRATSLFDVARVERTLGTLEGVTPEDAKRAARQKSQTFDERRTALLLEMGGDLYHYDLVGHQVRRLTRAAGREEE